MSINVEIEDLGVNPEPAPAATRLETPPRAADALKLPRTEAHREAQRKAAINQWKVRDRREGVPPPLQKPKVGGDRRTPIQVLLAKPVAADPLIQATLNQYIRETAEELGGFANLKASKKSMLLIQRTTLLIILCCEAQLLENKSLTDDDGRPSELLSVLRAYLPIFRQNEIAMGLGLRSRMPREDNLTIQSVIKEYQKRASKPLLVPEKGKPGGAA